jgi:hypothetical protein
VTYGREVVMEDDMVSSVGGRKKTIEDIEGDMREEVGKKMGGGLGGV